MRKSLLNVKTVFCVAALVALGAWGVGGATAQPGGRTVFTMTNSPNGNAVLVFTSPNRAPVSVPTGGLGTDSVLANQGGLVLDANADFLYVVNAGSGEISSFEVGESGITLIDKVPSGGTIPVSLAIHGRLLYVVNFGPVANITGFRVDGGRLTQIPNSTRPLSADRPGPAQISFDPTGRVLAVTERFLHRIDTYVISADGRTTGPRVWPSAAQAPFGFAFDRRGRLFVSDDVQGPNASGLSSYALAPDGTLTTITGFAGTGQTAACWVVVTKDGRFAYTTNTSSGTISSYRIAPDGSIALINGAAASTGAGSAPIDMALSSSGREVYVLLAGGRSIAGYRVGDDGSLAPLGSAGGLPQGANGLAAH
ncbi:MAG: 3-carboxymuconate cyclase [Actinobacteria bacterium]|nr:3-carboxymuconate cyclase [Actinomycetota bacterium]